MLSLREKQSKQSGAVDSIAESVLAGKVHLLEAPTGFGKTRVALRAAFAVRAKTGKGVIVSTKNNALAKKMHAESFCVQEDPLVNPSLVVLELGRRNYIEPALAYRSIAGGALHGKITEDEFAAFVGDQLEQFPHLKQENILISDLMEHLLSMGVVVSEDELVYEISQASDEAELKKDFDEIFRYLGEGMIVVTNHYYLLLLASLGGFEGFGYPIIADEVHSIGEAAESVFKNSFSFFRLKYLAENLAGLVRSDGVLAGEAAKTAEELAAIAAVSYRSSVSIPEGVQNPEEMVSVVAKALKAEILGKIGMKKINGITTSANHTPESRKYAAQLKQEVIELMGIADKAFTVSASPTRNYISISYSSSRPMYDLQKHLWRKVDRGFAGLSGTLRTSPHKDKSENGWIFFYLGLFKNDIEATLKKYRANGANAGKDETGFIDGLMKQNLQYDAAIFEVIDPVFDRNKHWAYVADKSFVPPKFNEYAADNSGKDGKGFKKIFRKKEDLRKDYEAWYEEIASFVHANLISNSLVLALSNEDCAMIGILLQAKSKGRYEVLYSSENQSMHAIVRQHKANVEAGKLSVIVGNTQFYTGIDLPGAELHQTFIARLPFEPKSYNNANQNKALGKYSSASDITHKMILNFRQGFGRTIRSEEDYGIVYVLDGRINNSIYAKAIGFLHEVSVRHDLGYIQGKAGAFLCLEGNDDEANKSPYARWFAELVFGEDETFENSDLSRVEDRAYSLKLAGFASKADAIGKIRGSYGEKKDLSGAVLAAHIYLLYEKTAMVATPEIKSEFGDLEAFYPVFFKEKPYEGRNGLIGRLIAW